MIHRLLVSSVAAGFAFLVSGVAHARPNVELTTTTGGADGGEHLFRVQNPGPTTESGVLELRHPYADHTVARAPFEVPAHTTRYFRVPVDSGLRCQGVAVTRDGTITSQDRRNVQGTTIIFEIPPRDDQRLQDLRVHNSNGAAVLTHAAFDEATGAPILTQRPAAYGGVSLVLTPSSVFSRLTAPEREALVTWVRTGGALALSVDDDADLARLTDLVGEGASRKTVHGSSVWSGGRLARATFGAVAELGLGRVHLLPVDPWSAKVNGDTAVQEKLVDLAVYLPDGRRGSGRFYLGQGALETTRVLDPNQGYRSVIALAGVLLAAQAIVTALGFRRLARRRGMASAYRFAAGAGVVGFAAVIGLGIYAKGGFRARSRELTFAETASGESVARVERNRMYFASDDRSVEVSPVDPAGFLMAQDSGERQREPHALLRVNEAGDAVLQDVRVRPWRATLVTEVGTSKLGGGVRVERANGQVVVRNESGSTLRNVLVADHPGGGCLAFGDIESGTEQSSSRPRSCTDLDPAWSAFDSTHRERSTDSLLGTHRLVLIGEIEEGPTTASGFRVEKRTTLLRVLGGAS